MALPMLRGRRHGQTRYVVALSARSQVKVRQGRGRSCARSCEVAVARNAAHDRLRGGGRAGGCRRWYQAHARPGVAVRFREAIEHALKEISETPDAFSLVETWHDVPVRRVLLRGSPSKSLTDE